MASNLNEILGRNIDSVKALKTAIKELQDSLVGLDTESQEYKDTAAKLATAQDALKDTTRAGIDANLAAKDSIVGMQKEYNKLYDAYKKLSDEQRNSDFGKNMAASLETLSNKLNETKQGVGNFKDNIGRYAQSVTDAFSKMGISVGALQGPLNVAKNGFSGLNTVMKANPIGLIITALAALIAIFKKVKDAIGQNEELQMRYNEAMSAFQPIVDAAKNALDALANKFVSFIEFVGNATRRIREFGAAITDWLGITENAKKDVQEQNRIYQSLAKSQNELTKMRRDYLKLNSESQKNLDNLRSEAAATTDLTEKKKLLTEAQALQEEINNRNLEIAQEELRILEEQASLTANDAAMNEKLAAAQAKVNDVQAEGARKMKELNSQLKSTNSTVKTTTTSITNYREEAKKLYEQTVENNKTEIQKLTEKYEKEKKLLEKYNYDTTLLTKKYNAEVSRITKKAEDQALEELKQKYEQRRKDTEKEWNLLKEDGKESVATALELENLEQYVIPSIKGLKNKVDTWFRGLFDQDLFEQLLPTEGFNTAFEKAAAKQREIEKLINDNGFSKLPDEYKEIKDAVKSANTEFNLGITTLNNLDLTVTELETNFKKLENAYLTSLGEEQLKKIQDAIKENYVAELEGLIKTVTYDTYGGYLAYVEEQNRKALEVEKTAIEEQLNSFSGTTEQKLEIMQRYYEVLAEMREKDHAMAEQSIQRVTEMFDNLIDMTDNMASSLASYKSTRESVIDSEVKAGNISEAEGKRRKSRLLELEKLERDFAIATIAADAATGAFKIWKGWATETGEINPITAAGNAYVLAGLNVASTISAVAKTAGLAATAAAQIAAAKGKYIVAKNNSIAESGGGGGSVGVGATPALIETTPYSYSRTVQTAEEEDRLNQPIWVSVEDISSALGQQVTVRNESSF